MTGLFDGFAITEEEVEEVLREARERKESRGRDGRICICGHAVARHKTPLGVLRCSPGRMRCPCQAVTPVLEVSDSRGFLSKTEGPGTQHALMKGLIYSRDTAGKSGSTFKYDWLVEVDCQRCRSMQKEQEGDVLPVSVTASGFVSEEPEAGNAFLCAECIRDLSRTLA